MAKILRSVDTLIAQVLISVYGEVLLITGIAYHNREDDCIGVKFYVSERQGDNLNFCVGFAKTGIAFTKEDVQAFVEENAVIHGEALARVYFEQVKAERDGTEMLDACQALEYQMEIGSENGAYEDITVDITVPLHPRLAELVDRSAIREFWGEYNEGGESITLHGSTEHTL